MKKILTIVLALMVAVMFFASPALAVDRIFSKFMVGLDHTQKAGMIIYDDAEDKGYNYGAYVVIAGDNNSQVVITSISATSDGTATTNNMLVFDKESSATVNSACDAGSRGIGVAAGGANFDVGDIIVLQDASGNTLYVETVTAVTATTIAIGGPLDGAIAATGWTVYEMEQIGQIVIQSATVSYQSDVAVVAGTRDSPVLILLGGAAACSINFASGHYK